MIRRVLGNFIAREDGAVLVLVAVGAVALIGMVGLAVDLGMLYTARSEAQRAADAAALAGASAFMEGDPVAKPELVTLAEARAYETAGLNRIRNIEIGEDEVTIVPLPAESKVRVTIRRENIGLWFARVLRINEAAVSASAAAEAAPASGANPSRCIKPFAIPDMWKKGPSSGQDLNQNQIWDFEPRRVPGCNGESDKCYEQERWTFEEGDTYGRPSSNEPTGYGSEFRSAKRDAFGREYNRDDGRRIPIKLQLDRSMFQLWQVDPDQPGANAAKAAMLRCIPESQRPGERPDAPGEITAEPGAMMQKIYEGVEELIDVGEMEWDPEGARWVRGRPGDPHAYWDEATGTVLGSDPQIGGWQNSARVMTVALFNPEYIGPGRRTLELVDFALLFLEDPRMDDNPDAGREKQPFKRTITARILKFTPGDAGGGGSEVGNLPKILRLVE